MHKTKANFQTAEQFRRVWSKNHNWFKIPSSNSFLPLSISFPTLKLRLGKKIQSEWTVDTKLSREMGKTTENITGKKGGGEKGGKESVKGEWLGTLTRFTVENGSENR